MNLRGSAVLRALHLGQANPLSLGHFHAAFNLSAHHCLGHGVSVCSSAGPQERVTRGMLRSNVSFYLYYIIISKIVPALVGGVLEFWMLPSLDPNPPFIFLTFGS